MKKALVILLALTMVMSMFAVVPFGASAADELAVGQVAADYKPEGTAINTAEEFAAMKADGTYYLAADITVDATYEDSFKGVFDGNGKTITTSVTLFEAFNGTMKNLTVAGAVSIDYEIGQHGKSYDANSPIAHTAGYEANTTFDNVCNKAHMTSSAAGMGGIVGSGGDVNTPYILTVKNCANYGSITADFASKNNDSGGIIGMFYGLNGTDYPQLIVDNCVNYGTVNACGRPGGIIGLAYASATFTNCVNNGKVQAIDNYCGGIAGRLGQNSYGGGDTYDSVFVVDNCVNNAALHYEGAKTAQLGGIVGYLGKCVSITFKNCTNNGDITATPNATANVAMGGIVANGEKNDADGSTLVFENCVNNGNLTTGNGWVTGDDGNYANVGGMIGRARVKDVTLVGCTNNGNVSGCAEHTKADEQRAAGGMVGRADYNVFLTECINNGDISNTYDVAGLVGNSQHNGGKDTIITSSGNTGNISGSYRVGGLVGYSEGSTTRGFQIKYCFNNGTVHSASKYAGGFVGYANTSILGSIEYNYVGGKITSDAEATPIKSGDAGVAGTEYTFNYNEVDYYFYLPYKATVVNITGNTVVPVYDFYQDAAALGGKGNGVSVADGVTVTKGVWCHYTDNGSAMAFKATANGTLSITADGVFIGTEEQNVACLDVKVYDHRINSTAFLWNNKYSVNLDMAKNIVEEDAAGLDYVMGALNTFICCNVSDEADAKYTAAQFADGTVTVTLNDMVGETVFYQNLNKELFEADAYPTTDSAHAKVVMIGGKPDNQLFDMSNDEGSPATGDAMIYVAVALAVSTISLAAVAVVRKKKEN